MRPRKRPAMAEKAAAKAETEEGNAEEMPEAEARSSGSTKLAAKALEQANLEGVTLEEKVAFVKEQHPEDDDGQAEALQNVLSKEENSKMWASAKLLGNATARKARYWKMPLRLRGAWQSPSGSCKDVTMRSSPCRRRRRCRQRAEGFRRATASFAEAGRPLFHLANKSQGTLHWAWRAYFVNPKLHACWLGEDFVGRMAMLSHSITFGSMTQKLSWKLMPK